MKNTFIIFSLLLTCILYGQVSIGSESPRGALDINKPITNNMGLVLPANPNVNNMINPQGGAVAQGTIMYDSTLDCIRVYRTTSGWSSCISESPTAITSIDCTAAQANGFLSIGVNASGVNSVIGYTGGDGSSHTGQTVNSTGVTGLTATLNAGSFANGTGVLTYNITGTPATAGTASFAISIGGRSCTLNRAVAPDDN